MNMPYFVFGFTFPFWGAYAILGLLIVLNLIVFIALMSAIHRLNKIKKLHAAVAAEYDEAEPEKLEKPDEDADLGFDPKNHYFDYLVVQAEPVVEEKAPVEKKQEKKAAKEPVVEAKPAEKKVAEAKPAEKKVVEAKPEEKKVAEAKPEEKKVAEVKPAKKAEEKKPAKKAEKKPVVEEKEPEIKEEKEKIISKPPVEMFIREPVAVRQEEPEEEYEEEVEEPKIVIPAGQTMVFYNRDSAPAKKKSFIVIYDKEDRPEEKAEEKTIEKGDSDMKAKAKEPVEEKKTIKGKMELCNSNLGGINYRLLANNGQLLYESKTYKNATSCREGAEGFVDAVERGMFTVQSDKFKRYKFNLKSPTSNNILYVGESFDSESACRSNIESVKRFAANFEWVNNISEDYKVELVAYEIPKDVVEAVKNKTGAIGKWVIEQQEIGKKGSPYVFLLYANNGQLLYESRGYSNAQNCKKGLETFRKTVQEGQFVIDPDKSGRYKFILRNMSNNSLMEYIGQNYSSERACAEGIQSLYRFALLSPTDTL